MTDIEQRLRNDATAFDDAPLSEAAAARLQQRLAATRQVVIERPGVASGGWWLPTAIAAAVVLVVLLLPARQPENVTPVMTTPVAGTTTRPVVDLARPARQLAEFEQVSRAVALEQEWVAIRDDLQRTREQIEAELESAF